MANHTLRVKLNGAPDLAVTGKVEKLADVRRLLRNLDTQIRAAGRMFPDLKTHKVLSFTAKAE